MKNIRIAVFKRTRHMVLPFLVICLLVACVTPGLAANRETYPAYLNMDGYRPIVKPGTDITLTMMVRRDTIATSDINEQWQKAFIEQVLGVKLDIEEVTSETYMEKRNLMFASNDLKDICINLSLTGDDFVTYGQEEGLLLPLSDYISEELTPNIYAALKSEPTSRLFNTTPDGKMYTIPSFKDSYPGFGNTIGRQRVFIDKVKLDAVGAKIPTTLDEFVEMLRILKEKGSKDIIPMLSTRGQDRSFILNAFGWLGGDIDETSPALDVDEKRVTIPCGEEEFIDYLRLMNTLYEEGLIHEEMFTLTQAAVRALYAEGRVGVLCDSAPYLSLPENFKDFVAATPLSSPYNIRGISPMEPTFGLGYVFVSANTEYPEVCMRLLDYLYSIEGSTYNYYGPPAGSDDLLGKVKGYKLSDDGTRPVYLDVIDGTRESDYDYRVNSLYISQEMPGDSRGTILNALRLGGAENPSYPQLNLDDPDDHYRYLVYQAQNAFLVPQLPIAFFDSDQMVKLTDLRTLISNYVKSESAKFIVGQSDIDDPVQVEKFRSDLMSLGYEEYRQMYVDVYAEYVSSLQ